MTTLVEKSKIIVKPDTKIESFKDKLINGIKQGMSTDEIMKEFEVHGTECEIYSRVVGFFRPVKAWNAGKQEEYKDRVEFVLEEKWKDINLIHIP